MYRQSIDHKYVSEKALNEIEVKSMGRICLSKDHKIRQRHL